MHRNGDLVNSVNSVEMVSTLRRLAFVLAAVGLLALGACGSGGGDGPPNPGGPPGPPVTVSGKITFDRVPFKTAVGSGLNLNAPIESPARLVVVEALDINGAILASTSSDMAGDYSLSVSGSTQIRIRAKAQMLKTGTAPTWNFHVLDNTNGDALYAIDGAIFNSGTAASTRNLRAASGWNGTSYAAPRAAAAFAILDTVYQARALLLSAVASTAFPDLNLFWSPTNKGSALFCPDTGDIVSSVYIAFGPGEQDQCGNAGVDGIYVLGDFANGNGDTDEFDQHVIAHEFGHYVEDQFSRSDSIGGAHSLGDRLDLRVAFGEGWGNAFGAMTLNDPVYRDSSAGQAGDTGFNMDADALVPNPVPNPGWYSEASVHEILWDIFDGGTEAGDTVNLPFAAIFSTFTGAQRTTDALTSIYSFASALSAANPGSATGIAALLSREQISGSGAFGTGETNFAGKALLNPTYTTITLGGGPVQVCGTTGLPLDPFGTYNKLGNRRFLRLDLTSARAVQITAQGELVGTPAADPDIGLWGRGLIGTAEAQGTTEVFSTPVLAVGTYIIEVADFSHIDQTPGVPRRGDSCITVSVI